MDRHPIVISDLTIEIPHSIELAPAGFAPALSIDRYNCFEFALGLAGRREVMLISSFVPSTCCNATFVEYLIPSPLTAVGKSPSDGDLVLYRDSQQFTHAGLIHHNRVLSKWGEGYLWLHDLLEVPASYGDSVSFFASPNPDEILTKFIEFAHQREGSDLVDEVLGFEVPRLRRTLDHVN